MTEPAQSHPSLDPELSEYRATFLDARLRGAILTADLSDSQFNWRARPGRWSIAECLSHLNIVGRQYNRMIKGLIDGGRRRRMLTGGVHRHGFWGNILIRMMEPPVRFRLPAPRRFRPATGYGVAQVVPAFIALQEEYVRLIESANGLDLGSIRIPNPAFRMVELSLGQSFGLVASHQRRHLWQAERVRSSAAFPVPQETAPR